jgi:Asp-tRNA(Asn)/Glu-tRNA(Gln) amidotransferase A subunit family amidase
MNSFSVSEINNLVCSQEVSACDIIKNTFDLYKEIEPKVNAWSQVNLSLAMEAAEIVDNKIKNNEVHAVDNLLGVPLGVKDCYNTEQLFTARGSPIYEEYSAGNDARIIRHARDLGGIIFGKTTTAEFSIHHPPKTRNPYNFEHAAGTSSAGSAVAVATGLVPLSFGTQTAASTSKPASYCGVYGFKPTFGVLPRTGVLKTSDTLDTLSLFTRELDDIVIGFESLRLRGRNYPLIETKLHTTSQKESSPMKIAFFADSTFYGSRSFIQNSFLEFFKEIERELAIEIKFLDLPEFLNDAKSVHNDIYAKSISYYFNFEYKEFKEKLSTSTLNLIEEGRGISTDSYKLRLNEQQEKSNLFENWFDFDVAITLPTSGTAPVGFNDSSDINSSLIWTLLGLPMLVCPKFFSPEGLPFGLQIIAKKYDDYRVISFAKKLEDFGFLNKVSPVSVK